MVTWCTRQSLLPALLLCSPMNFYALLLGSFVFSTCSTISTLQHRKLPSGGATRIQEAERHEPSQEGSPEIYVYDLKSSHGTVLSLDFSSEFRRCPRIHGV